MSQKRQPEEEAKVGSSDGGGGGASPEEKRQKVPALRRVIMEAVKMDQVQKLLNALEPLVRRVVQEEVERALKTHLPSMTQPCGKQIHPSNARNLQLQFRNKLSLPIFTGSRIEGEDFSVISIDLVDALTGEIVISGPESSMKLEIVVLEGDFEGTEDGSWTLEEFKNNVVREREGKRSLLTGDVFLDLNEGIGVVGELSFTDNSSWTRSRKFRLGARSAASADSYFNGMRIQEAKTEAFMVKDHRGELYKKHYPPVLWDEVWRLEKIGKDGAFHRRLSSENINTVKDFLTLLTTDATKLRNILGSGMSAKMWEVTVEHARTCILTNHMHVYYSDNGHQMETGSRIGVGVVFNVVGEVMGLLSENHFVPVNELSETEKVLIAKNTGSKERAQAHIRELEEEVKLLKNLSHPNIVRYIGTAREEETLNILLEFVPGGSISSLLGKFGSFPEAVIRMYTKQLLQGLEYLHQNGIIHRDIKGANILVDNKGCIRLADFGASKQVAKLATMTAAKSMKGTPYWMAPEVILQTGHSFSADIWSVGCTVIEMATGKPPWSQQYQEVAALFHIGSTKSHPPIPEHLSLEAKDFLSKCLQKEPSLRPTASDLIQHPFVRRDFKDPHPMYRSSVMEPSKNVLSSPKPYTKNSFNPVISRNRPIWDMNINDDMCRLDDNYDNSPLVGSVRLENSFNPVAEPVDEWPCHFFDSSLEQRGTDAAKDGGSINGATSSSVEGDSDFRFPCELVCEGDEDDEVVTETKIRAFLDEKALDLKKLQTPLFEEFFNSLNATSEPCIVANVCEDVVANNIKLPSNCSRSSSPSKAASGVSSAKQQVDNRNCCSPVQSSGTESTRILREIPSPRLNEWGGLPQDVQQEYNTTSSSSSERRRKWKEELDRELEKEREKMMCRAGVGVKTSPKDSGKGIGAAGLLNRKVILDQRFRSSIAHDRQRK